MQKYVLIGLVAGALIIVGWVLYRTAGDTPAEPQPVEAVPPTPPPPAPVAAPAPQPTEPETPTEPEVVLPPLADSDPFVRERLEPLALPEPWLDQGDYVRRLAVLAENASRGEVPRRQLGFLAPTGPFRVIEREDGVYIDPASYRRYDAHVASLVSVPPETAARLIGTLQPLIEAALTEIGVTAPPGQVLSAAIAEVLAVPELDGDVALAQPTVMYTYADPALEALSPVQKQVLRMGPDNVRRIKAYARELAAALDLSI